MTTDQLMTAVLSNSKAGYFLCVSMSDGQCEVWLENAYEAVGGMERHTTVKQALIHLLVQLADGTIKQD